MNQFTKINLWSAFIFSTNKRLSLKRHWVIFLGEGGPKIVLMCAHVSQEVVTLIRISPSEEKKIPLEQNLEQYHCQI